MTKRQLVKWLEAKQSDAKADVEIQYATAEKAYFAQRDEALKINETVDEVFRLISEADTVVSRWKEALEKVKGIDTTRGWYTSLTTKLSDLSDKENIRMYIMKDFTDGTDTLRQLKAKRSETLREIEKNYTNVIANVESMKNAKTAVEYLEKLGFDLSALIEADNHPVTTALTEEEIMCIRYHMGAFCDKSEWNDYTRAVHKYTNVLWTHQADMLASHVEGV